MTDVGYVCAVLLAAVLAWAGRAKLRAPAETASSFRGLGLPAARSLARVVPAIEMGTAVALLTVPRVAGWAALVLLVAFSFVLTRAILRGLDVGCACFGASRSEPVSTLTLVRNGLLAALAVLSTAADRPRVPSLASLVLTTTVAAVALVLLSALAMRRDVGALFANRTADEDRST